MLLPHSSPLLPSAPDSHSRPSLFELIAQDQLRDLFHPVFRYVLTYLAQRYPRYLLRLLNHHEEAFAFLLLIIENHHLKKHSASLSEHFYHLTTTPITLPTPRLDAATRSDSPLYPNYSSFKRRVQLSRGQRWALLFVLVGIPYIRARAQDLYDRVSTLEDDNGLNNTSIPQNLSIRVFRTIYPYANLAFDASLLAYDVSYLFGGSYRPWHQWLGVQIQRRERSNDESWINLPPLLPPLLLALKLAQWWYSPTSPRALSSTTSTPVHTSIQPPPPLPILPTAPLTPPVSPLNSQLQIEDQTDSPHNADFSTVIEKSTCGLKNQCQKHSTRTYKVGLENFGKCPVCKNKWRNPSILPSGWVMCWRCAWDTVVGDDEEEVDGAADLQTESEKNEVLSDEEVRGGDALFFEKKKNHKGTCPITGIPVRPDEIRRVLV